MLGWVGNVLSITGYFLAGRKSRYCWHFIFLGSLIWFIYGWRIEMLNIMFIKIVCVIIAARNIYLWKNNDKKNKNQ